MSDVLTTIHYFSFAHLLTLSSFVQQLSYRELQLQTLWLTFLSFDPSSRHEVIGQVVLPLADLELSRENVFRTDIRPSLKVNLFIVALLNRRKILACVYAT